VRGALRCFLQCGRSDLADLIQQDRRRPARPDLIGQTQHATLDEPAPPLVGTDFLGLVLAVIVTAASVSNTAGGRDLIDRISVDYPSVAEILVDNGYQKSVIERGAAVGIDVTVTQKPGEVKGFQPTARWAVERTFGWFMQHRRLVRPGSRQPRSHLAPEHPKITCICEIVH
jgi:hypothetical protein